ncbi:MAG TPA: PD-(D/E)XK nuclease family protein, partial [Streptosporangiaceae bacterium]|nr:PD-(D/E)XK nuclease family protein [Streptosporangiaceae bacterium]
AGAAYEPAAPAVSARPPEPTAAAPEVPAETRRLFRTEREELLKSLVTRLPTTATGLVGDAAAQSQEPPDPLEAPAAGPADWTAARSAGGGGAALGSTVHRALEILDLGEATDQAVNRAVTAACAELGVPHLAGEVRSRVQAALTAPIIQLAATRRHWKEVPIVAELGGRVVEGFIDLVVDTDEGLVIVDYKTDSTRSAADIETKVHHYTPQIRAYAQALALATGGKVATPQILFCRPAGVTAVNVP